MGNKLWDFFNKHFAIILVGVLFFIWYFDGCGNRKGDGKNTSDTTIHTVQQPQPIIIMPQYQPNQSGPTIYPINIPQQYVPSTDTAELRRQYVWLRDQFLAERRYEDSIQLKDTAGNRVGVVNLKQMVSENMLKYTQPSYQLNFPHTYTTITNTINPKPKNQVYIGLEGAGMVSQNINTGNIQLGLLFKNKRDNVFGVSGGATLKGDPIVTFKYYQKIHL